MKRRRKRTDASDLPSLWKSWFREAKAIPRPRATQRFTSCLARWNFKISLWSGGHFALVLYGVRGTRAVFFVFYSPLLPPHLYLGCQEEKAKTPNSLGSLRRAARLEIFIRPFCLWGGFLRAWCQSFSPGKNSLVFTCSEGAGQRPRSLAPPSETPDTSPTVRVFAHTDLKHLHTHPNTVSLGRNCVAPLCCVLACSPADRRRRKKEVLKISVAIDRMKPNGGIYFQPSGVNSLSGFGWRQATPCLSDMLSFRSANKQQTSTCRLFLSETDGQKSCLPWIYIGDLLMMHKKPTGIFFYKFLLLLPTFVHNYLYFLLLALEKNTLVTLVFKRYTLII